MKLKLWFQRNFAPKAYRYTIYRWMYEYMLTYQNYNLGYCNVISAFNSRYYNKAKVSNYKNMVKLSETLPELFKFKPSECVVDKHNGFWFPCSAEGYNRRLEILEEILYFNNII